MRRECSEEGRSEEGRGAVRRELSEEGAQRGGTQ